MCAPVYVYKYVFVCVCEYVCLCVDAVAHGSTCRSPRLALGCSQFLSILRYWLYILVEGQLLNLMITGWLQWLSSELPGSTCLCVISTEVTGACYHTFFSFNVGPRDLH